MSILRYARVGDHTRRHLQRASAAALPLLPELRPDSETESFVIPPLHMMCRALYMSGCNAAQVMLISRRSVQHPETSDSSKATGASVISASRKPAARILRSFGHFLIRPRICETRPSDFLFLPLHSALDSLSADMEKYRSDFFPSSSIRAPSSRELNPRISTCSTLGQSCKIWMCVHVPYRTSWLVGVLEPETLRRGNVHT